MKFVKDRPVMFWGTMTTLLSAVIGALVLFEAITLTPEQMAQIMVIIAAMGQMFVFLIQGQVTPTNNPKDDAGNMLTPGTIGNDEADLPPI
jgi:hypothetical protein